MRWTAVGVLMAACGAPVGSDDAGETDDTEPQPWRAVFFADPHIIGDDYQCCESPGLDTDSIYKTRRRMMSVRDQVNALDPAPAHAFMAGDVFHQAYKWDDVAAYATNGSAPQRAHEIMSGFDMPVHYTWGNHDYEVPEFSREFAHEVQASIFGQAPYQAVEHEGWRFLLGNTQLGRSWGDPMDAFYDTGKGSFGREQLAWMAEQLDAGDPSVMVFHHPLLQVPYNEDPEGPWPDIYAIIEAYRDVIKGIYVGHMHTWLDFSAVLDLPYIVLGSVRYDADNWWLYEFRPDGTFEILDFEKAQWGGRFAYTTDYREGNVIIDLLGVPEDDPAGPWEGWNPDPWPPAE